MRSIERLEQVVLSINPTIYNDEKLAFMDALFFLLWDDVMFFSGAMTKIAASHPSPHLRELAATMQFYIEEKVKGKTP